MKTVSNSVRMIAPVGQTSMQLACWQCLHTSDMSRKALPLPSLIVSSGTLSMNFTWRQVEPFSSPVLSRLWPRKPASPSGSWFHSLHATSQALQPMQTLVSVKNPYGLPAVILVATLEPHEIRCHFRQPLVRRVQVEGQCGQFVDLRHRARVAPHVDLDQVAAARRAARDAKVREDRRLVVTALAVGGYGPIPALREHREPRLLALAACRADASRAGPARTA